MQPFIRAYDCGIILVVRFLGAVAEAKTDLCEDHL